MGQELYPDLLYHYTSTAGLIGIIENKMLWATSILHLNDTKEYNEGVGIIDEQFKKKKKSRKKFAKFFDEVERAWNLTSEDQVFIASFSEHKDQLSQWRGYTPDNAGFSLGFDFHDEQFVDVDSKWAKNSGVFHLVKCIYETDEKIRYARAFIDNTIKDWEQNNAEIEEGKKTGRYPIIKMSLLNYKIYRVILASAFKNPSFAEEAEWRFIFLCPLRGDINFRPGPSFITPYHEIPINLAMKNLTDLSLRI